MDYFVYTGHDDLLIELKKLFLEKRITQREIAGRLGLKPQGLQKLMNKANFSFDDAARILDAIGYYLVIAFDEKKD